MKKLMKIILASAFFLCCTGATALLAQGLSGPTTVANGSSHNYLFQDDFAIAQPTWNITGGIVTNSWQVGINYYATVQWTTPGSGVVDFLDGTTSLASLNVTVSNDPAPGPPTANAANAITTTSFTASWSAPMYATSYRLDVSTVATFVSFVNGFSGLPVTSTSYSVTGLAAGTPYYYRVRASNVSGTSTNSNIITVITRPAAPVSTAATAVTATSFDANWNASFGATAYELDVSKFSNFSSAVSTYGNIITTSKQVTGLDPGNVYYYRVRAINSSGASPVSNTSWLVTRPPAPVATAATAATTNSFTANWSITTGTSFYDLDVSEFSNFSSVLATFVNLTTTAKQVSGLTPGRTYYYRVRAVNGSGSSANSSTITAVTVTLPPVATAATAITSNSFTANWNTVANTTGYRLDVSTKPDFSTFVPGFNSLSVTANSQVVSPLDSKEAAYYYRVRAVNAGGESDNSNIIIGVDLNRNYIRSIDILVSGVTAQSQVDPLSLGQKAATTAYLDGLGRPAQTVAWRQSPAQQDVVQPIGYDALGREAIQYLPYVSGNDGWLKLDFLEATQPGYTSASSPHYQFYQNTPKIVADAKPFAQKIFEPSPINRLLEQGSPGLNWQPDASNSYTSTDRTVKFAYQLNEANEVLKWTYGYPSSSNVFGTLSASVGGTPVYYQPSELTRAKTKDEQGNEVFEYTDREGRIVLKRVKVVSGAASTTDTNRDINYASTYYIYNDFGKLVAVLQPEGVKNLAIDYFPTSKTEADRQAFLRNWAFRYRFDARMRMTHKQVPGADSVLMVYDSKDRLVLTQDGKQRAGAPNAIKYWSFTKYDELNRPVLTGIKDTTTTEQLTQALMQKAVNEHFAKASARWGESYVGNAAGNVHGYTNRAYPVRTGTTTSEIDPNKYLTATYYDNYNFRSTWVGSYDYVNEGLSEPGQGITYDQPTIHNIRVIGQVTGSKVKVLDGGPTGGFTWLKSVTYYDDKYRVIQTIADNYKGGTDRVTNVVDFVGKVLETKLTHVERDVQWRNLVSTAAHGAKIFRTNTGGIWNAGAASVQTLAAGQAGDMEFVATETNTYRMMGLSDVDSDQNYTSIDYAWYLINNGTLNIYESGASRGAFGTYLPGDVFKIERSGTTIRYYQNNTLKYTSTVGSSSLLMVDASLHTTNTTLTGVRASFATTTRTTTRRFEYDHAGRLLRTWHKIDAQPEILLALNEYNELGQLVDKKLHSTVANGSNAKQSVDYRYNIRGWLTSMNNARLVNDAINDDTNANDLFGMELGYENTLSGLGNTGLFNGNISGMKYSSYGNGPIKEKGYTYTYDALNRLKTSQYRQRTGSVPSVWETATNQWAETGFDYDLNGNITFLKRNETAPNSWMDDLTYTYTGNQLLRVTDAGDDFAGFLDGQPGTGNDYTYDPNGNMMRDLNKGIGTSLTDATNLITYNFLNLPETVTKGTNSVRYIYDATGRKLTQVTTFGSQQKQTDYAGEFIYENDALQFINHEEGRIAVAATKMVYTHDGVNTTGITATTSTLAPVTLNAQKYIRATAVGTTARQGMFPIGGTITVAGGEQYRIRAKGYRTGANTVHVYARLNSSTDLNWPGSQLANGAVAEAWSEQIITIPGTTTATLHVGVVWDNVTAGEQFFLNDFEITKLETITPEYQYHLKDHLGNVRLSFTSKDEVDEKKATLEASTVNADRAAFLKYDDARRVYSAMFDYTNGTSPGYAQRLSGTATETLGLARSLALMPGDKLKVEVYAKYFQVSNTDAAAFNSWVAAFISGASVPASVLDGAGYTTNTGNSIPYANALNKTGETGTAPMAYLNWIVYDKNFLPIPALSGYRRITTNAQQGAGADVGHEKLESPLIDITQPGYAYIWLSNENATPVEVYFDDFKVTHTKSPVIQAEEYYPFGLTFNSFGRENSLVNQYKFNSGSELIPELNLNWYNTSHRNYDPGIGRFWGVDAMADLFPSISPSLFAYNNPIMFNDPLGLFGVGSDTTKTTMLQEVTIYANRPAPDFSWLYNYIGGGDSPIHRAVKAKGDDAYRYWHTNRTIHFGVAPPKSQWAKDFDRVFGTALNTGVTGTILIAVAAPVVIEAVKGNLLPSAKEAVQNMALEGISQVASGTEASDIDLFDLAISSGFGFNTFGSIFLTSNFNISVDGGFQTMIGTKESYAEMATGAAAAGANAFFIDRVKGDFAKNASKLGVDWSLKVISNQLSKARPRNEKN